MFGLIWRYYALMNGTVFEITDWAKCQVKRDNFKHMAANSHQVIYRLAGDGSGRSGGVGGGGGRGRSEWMPENGPRSASGRPPSEADLENLISNLFASKNASAGGGGGAGEGSGAAAAATSNPSGAAATTAAPSAASNAKVGKKSSKKKRH